MGDRFGHRPLRGDHGGRIRDASHHFRESRARHPIGSPHRTPSIRRDRSGHGPILPCCHRKSVPPACGPDAPERAVTVLTTEIHVTGTDRPRQTEGRIHPRLRCHRCRRRRRPTRTRALPGALH
ncbi:hypothetical protein AORI_4252 [Amycolatopsis keratiniphila]|uniref:Uncharacterized protein n=1 Tax=Amycolatopsis keratiniphila TaxID=129921 RepID=R4T777_9PSEU|nr:hypothetical protein AORI_4252 [Amycolatopsis keratiniphila]